MVGSIRPTEIGYSVSLVNQPCVSPVGCWLSIAQRLTPAAGTAGAVEPPRSETPRTHAAPDTIARRPRLSRAMTSLRGGLRRLFKHNRRALTSPGCTDHAQVAET